MWNTAIEAHKHTIRKCYKIIINGAMRIRGRSKRIWMEVMKKNMIVLDLCKKMVLNRVE